MKRRTFLKREGRYFRLVALQCKRCHWWYEWADWHDCTCNICMEKKMDRRYSATRRLYHAAYAAVVGKPEDGQRSVRQTMRLRVDRAFDRRTTRIRKAIDAEAIK